jgi:hypothetical protein
MRKLKSFALATILISVATLIEAATGPDAGAASVAVGPQ